MPSELLFIRDPVAAYSLNNAVWSFGTALEEALSAASDGEKNENKAEAKRKQVMERYLPSVAKPGATDAPKKPAAAFADPAKMMGR